MNERQKKDQVAVLAKIYNTTSKELLAIWLADKVYELVEDEETAPDALKIVESQYKNRVKKINERTR